MQLYEFIKGDTVPRSFVAQWAEVDPQDDFSLNLALMECKAAIQEAIFSDRGERVCIKSTQGCLRILTDSEAIGYTERVHQNKKRRMRENLRDALDIRENTLSPYEVHRLEHQRRGISHQIGALNQAARQPAGYLKPTKRQRPVL